MNAVWIVIAAICTYIIGFRFYARLIEMKIVRPRDDHASRFEQCCQAGGVEALRDRPGGPRLLRQDDERVSRHRNAIAVDDQRVDVDTGDVGPLACQPPEPDQQLDEMAS